MIDLVAIEGLARPGERAPIGLLEPPFCYGAWRGPRIDLPVLRVRARARLDGDHDGLVLTDIPDDDDSLAEALEVPGVLGALAVACGWVDVWVREAVAERAGQEGLSVRRGGTEGVRGEPSRLARVEVRELPELRRLWAVLEDVARGGLSPGARGASTPR